MKRQSGQILILVLLVVVVALAVGLSVASRNITNLRTSTQTEHSQRAFSAAEGGVEDVLSRLSTLSVPVGGQTTIDVPVGDITAKVDIKGSNIYQTTIDDGNVGQIDLAGGPGSSDDATGDITIEWAKNSEVIESAEPASIEVTQVYGSSPNYSQKRYAYTAGVAGRDETGFSSGNCIGSGEFKCSVSISLETNPVLLRIRPFWLKTTVKVTGTGSLPLQTYDLTSTAKTDLGLTRRVQVQRTVLPQLPAAFDYVLFSEGNIVK